MQFITLFFLATFIEAFVKYIVDGLPEKIRTKIKPYIPYCTLVLGLLIALNYRLDIFLTWGLPLFSVVSWVSYIITGVVIGRGSNYLNDLATSIKNLSLTQKEKTVDNPPFQG